MDEITSFEYSTGPKALESNIYEYKVDGKKVLKIDYPDNNGFIAVHKQNGETEYFKAPYMKFSTTKSN
ncbi:hypothetical protein [Levilactobacillus lindianensis]|uniref:hypothetical protein n=1 Tax=Levilactobacillus lindianensis TaxID=2486018 RepID=UPI000F7370D4|nr:hypothetical protein [Levilactobacillus lindianensis]